LFRLARRHDRDEFFDGGDSVLAGEFAHLGKPFRATASLITQWGFPCCVRFPCVHAAATTPVQQRGILVAQTAPSISAFPDSTVGSACTSSFSRSYDVLWVAIDSASK